MGQREELSSMFEYDQWANLKWMGPAHETGQESVMLHIVDAEIIWLSRIEGTPRWQPTLEDYPMHVQRSTRNWKRMLMGADLQAVVSYTNFQGEQHENSICEITSHVINHGTYHRGHLRGIAGERGLPFPETDYIAYLRDNAGLNNMRHAAVVEMLTVPQ